MTIPEELDRALAPWLGPVAADAPAGPDPRALPAYQSVREEIAKLESPAAGPCRWDVVERDATAVLATSKDLSTAAYLAGALAQRRGVEGLALGTTLLAELLRRHETLHPARPRARANALAWFVDRAEQHAGAAEPAASDRAHVSALERGLGVLRAAAAERLGDDAPSTGRLADAVQRLVLSLPAQAAPTPAPVATAAPPPTPPITTTSSAPAPAIIAPPPITTPAPEVPQDLGKLPHFLAQLGSSLCATASALRASRPHDVETLRLLLAGLYLPVVQVPPTTRERRTGLPGPASALRAEIDRLRHERDPARLLDVATRALDKHRFWLDLHLAVHEALAALGPVAAATCELHERELRALVARLPGLLDVELADGTPFASKETRAWLEGLAGGASARNEAPAESSPTDATLRDARELLRAGKAHDALDRAQSAVRLATTARDRFAARLELAALALDAKSAHVALAIAAELHREATARDLADWDAPLAARACTIYLRAAGAERGAAVLPIPHAEVYGRLCLLDPAAAASLTRG